MIWSRARDREREIFDDLRARFEVLRVLEVAWTRRRFSENLTRFYGQKLPSRSQKERHCGTGPFLLVVVRDIASQYALRGGRRAPVNVRTWEARERYREWTGGGHRVHASLDAAEADHDLFLLIGLLADAIRPEPWDGTVARVERDLVGSGGWADLRELFTALTVTLRWVALSRPASGELVLLVDDEWAAHATLLGRRNGRATEITVGGRPVRVVVHSTEHTERDARPLAALDHRVRRGDMFVPAAADAEQVAGWAAEQRSHRRGAVLGRFRR